MRFLGLDLIAFGPFSDVAIDLSQGEFGLHVVYGPNEAGKSSALRAIHGALFGIPHNSTDNFRHGNKDLRIGAQLRNGDASEFSFLRRKGRKDTLLNPDHPQQAAYSSDVLAPFLNGVDGDTFERVYGINHDGLRTGGKQLQLLKGLAGESLFAASLGGPLLANVLAQLDAEAAELFGKRGSKIRVAINEYNDLSKAKREAAVPASRWEALQADLAQARTQREEVVTRLRGLRKESSRLERLRRALKWIADLGRLREAMANIGDVTVLPDSYSAEERGRCQTELAMVRGRIETLTAEIEGADGLDREVDSIALPADLLEQEDGIAALQEWLGAHTKAARDLTTNVQVRHGELTARVEALVRELGVSSSLDDLEHLRLAPDKRVAIQSQANDEKPMRGKPDELARQRRQVQQVVENDQDQLKQLGPARDTGELRRHADAARQLGPIESELVDLRADCDSRQVDAQRKLAALGLFSGTLEQVASLPVPLAETVGRFEQEFADRDDRHRRLTDKHDGLHEEAAKVEEEVATLRLTDNVPTEEDLDAARKHRDAGWRLVRQAWETDDADAESISSFATDRPLADAYEASVASADAISDRLRREADRVATLAGLQARKAQLEQRLRTAADEVASSANEQESLQQEWVSQWTPADIEPLSPREMRGWLERLDRLATVVRDIETHQAKIASLEEASHAARSTLSDSLVAFGGEPRDEATLTELLERSQALLDQATSDDQRRQELQRDIARSERELKQLAGDEAAAREALESWEAQWSEAMTAIGCPADAGAGQANERMACLQELFKCVDDVASLNVRMQGMEEDARSFEAEVTRLVERVAPDLADQPVTQAASQLRTRLDRAREDKVRLDQLVDVREKKHRELEQARQQQRQLETQLTLLCQAAGVDSPDALPDVERDSGEYVARRRELDDVERELLELSGGRTIDELVAETEGQDADELSARLAELDTEIESLDHQREDSAAEVRELENKIQAADGSSDAAAADERALGLIGRIHDDSQHYMRLRLAATILQQQIEKHRAENQDPLLTRASSLFSRVTCGEFGGLRTDYNDNDQPVLAGVRKSDELVHVDVDGMSDGTRDQLYFALRLAYLERRLIQHEPLPFIVDDILIHYDDHRALATLEVLIELSRQTQVIFFTHHRHLVELAETHLPANDLFVHTLGDVRVQPKSLERALPR